MLTIKHKILRILILVALVFILPLGFDHSVFAANITQGGNSFGTTVVVGSNDNQSLALETNNTERLRIDTSGNVGIGAASPASNIPLWIEKTRVGDNLTLGLRNDDNTNASSGAQIDVISGGSSAGDAFAIFGISGGPFWSVGMDNSDAKKFKIASDVGLGTADKLTIDTSGNIGVGTTAPTAKLQVAGGDVAITTQGNGLILRATDGANCFRVTVNNAGILNTASVTCP